MTINTIIDTPQEIQYLKEGNTDLMPIKTECDINESSDTVSIKSEHGTAALEVNPQSYLPKQEQCEEKSRNWIKIESGIQPVKCSLTRALKDNRAFTENIIIQR